MNFIPKILIADDHEVNIEVIEAYLLQSRSEVEIFRAMDGLETIKLIETVEPDLVLLDVMMPRMDGFEVCSKIKSEQEQNLPVIMITSLHDKESLFKGLEAGADDFLSKPVDRHELMVRVNNLLKVRKLTNDLKSRYQELRRELDMARKLQQGFLPKSLPNFRGLELGVMYQPSIGVGGDFYDFLYLNENSLGIFIADVSGHGVSSAMITAVLKDHIRKLKKYWSKPQEFLKGLNEEMYHFFMSTGSDYFITAFYGIFNLKENQLIYSNAGHPAPLHISGERLIKLNCKQGFPLGLFQGGVYETRKISFLSGDKVYLFTDGLYELEVSKGKLLTYGRLEQELAKQNSLSPGDLIKYFESYISKLTGYSTFNDDINLIAVERLKDVD